MHKGRLTKLGNSWAVIVPKTHLQYLGWFPADEIQQDIVDGNLVMRNVTQHSVTNTREKGRSDEFRNSQAIE